MQKMSNCPAKRDHQDVRMFSAVLSEVMATKNGGPQLHIHRTMKCLPCCNLCVANCTGSYNYTVNAMLIAGALARISFCRACLAPRGGARSFIGPRNTRGAVNSRANACRTPGGLRRE